ncbi:transcription factor GTE12-like isoform X2 [Salvia divinorum]|uniref:Transcription factor GTE12-like isoform X2 n=1 Tax=Salvia divinorum TaxID=28513 RepID=A0ABD1HKT6_SALDI
MAENQSQAMSCCPKKLPHEVATNKTARPNFKFRITPKGVVPKVEDKLREVTDGTRMPSTVKPSAPLKPGKRMPEVSLDSRRCKKRKMSCEDRVAVNKPREANVSVKPSHKRGLEMSIDDERWKMQKMDCNVKLDCSKILKEFMDRRLAQAFRKPVDLVKTPGYFKKIKNPMDLGTIKRNLERNMYSTAKEFADDMLLTFRNAMSYHSPSSEVYCNARLLACNFKRRWGILPATMKPVVENKHQVMKPMKAPTAEKRGYSGRVSMEEKLKLEPKIKNEETTLNGCTSLSKIADKGVKRCQELSIDCTRESVPNGEKIPSSTSTTTPASAAKGVQMSPKKALRVAMLKSRFANNIFEATHPALSEKTSIEEPLKAAEMPSRERERNVARMALEKIKKTVEIDMPPSILREMDNLFGCYPNPKSLEKIGFYLKQNYVEEYEV